MTTTPPDATRWPDTWSPGADDQVVRVRRVPTARTHVEAIARWEAASAEVLRVTLAPPARVGVVEWLESNLVLPSDNTSAAGPWRSDEVPFLREILEAFVHPDFEEGVLVKSAQLGVTVSVAVGIIAYFVAVDPRPIMLMQPTLDDAARFSKKKLMPIVRASPVLAAKIGEARPGDARNTILQKTFPGGSLEMPGATSPRQMRSDSIGVLLMDERSGYPRSAGVEGDPGGLARKRTLTFDPRRIFEFSTPTVTPDPTEQQFQDSDQRYYEVPCPECGTYQRLDFENLRWDKTEHPDGSKTHHFATAHFVCTDSGCVIEERHKRAMVTAGRWIARNPGHKRWGWFIWQAYSLFPNANWALIAEEWVKAVAANAAGDPEKLKLALNTVLARSYEERGERPDAEGLKGRREPYAAEVPMGVGVLVMAIDVQAGDNSRLEVAIKGYGAGEESWLIAHVRIFGDTTDPTSEAWRTADALRTRAWRHESGQDLYVRCCVVDSGDQTDVVYDWVGPRQRAGVYAVKGDSGKRQGAAPIYRPGKGKKKGVRLFLLGVDTLKTRVFGRLRILPDPAGPDGTMPAKAGLMHFPLAQDDGADDTYLAQFGNEKAILRKGKTGQPMRKYVKTGANEALDLEVYCLAALHILGQHLRDNLGVFAARLANRRAPAATLPTAARSSPARRSVASDRPALPATGPRAADVGAAPGRGPQPRSRGRRVLSRGVY